MRRKKLSEYDCDLLRWAGGYGIQSKSNRTWRRLEKLGLVTSEPVAFYPGDGRLHTLTEAGRSVLNDVNLIDGAASRLELAGFYLETYT